MAAEERSPADPETSNLFYGPIPVQECHEMLAKHERLLSDELPSINIVLAALTIVLQDGENLYTTTKVLEGRVPLGQKRPDRTDTFLPYFFPSTASAHNSEKWAKPTAFGTSNTILWGHLNGLIAERPGLDITYLAKFDLASTAPRPGDVGFSRDLQHSEQKLMQHFMDILYRASSL